MKFHIVRSSETLDDILFLYNLTKDELMEENRHIRVWNKIIPGTKLKIPPITEAVEQDLGDMEPFVEDYYPKLNFKEYDGIPEDEIPLEAEIATPDVTESPTIVESEAKSKKPEGKQEKNEIKSGYPPELLKMKEKKPMMQKELKYAVGYQYPYGYYYHPVVPYRVVYYPVHETKKPI